jgi:hypothetical protein
MYFSSQHDSHSVRRLHTSIIYNHYGALNFQVAGPSARREYSTPIREQYDQSSRLPVK